MNNSEYNDALAVRLIELQELRKKSIKCATGIIGANLLLEDLFFISALNRSVDLLDGMIEMLKNRNLACVGILLRSQIDNCMRIFAAFITEDKTSFMNGFMSGKPISAFKDDRGRKMKDYVLRERLEAYDPHISVVYEKSSGYVHLSDVAFISSVWTKDDNKIELSVGHPIREDANDILLEGADAYIHYTKFQLKLLQPVIESKERVDKKINSSEVELND